MTFRWRRGIGGKFATRLFARFLLAAALPIAAIAGLASLYTTRVISNQAYERLHRAANTYGLALYSRLLLAQDQLQMVKSIGNHKLSLKSKAFSAVALFPKQGTRQLLLGNSSALPKTLPHFSNDLSSSEPALYYANDGGRPQVLMSEAAGPSGGWVIGSLNPHYLFGSQDGWPYATRYCVLTAGRPIFCPGFGSKADEIVQRMVGSGNNARATRIALDGKTLWAVHWDLFLPSAFQASDWRIVALQPQSQALASYSAFVWNFPPTVLLALMAASLIGVNQIRRTNRPLQNLRDGVHEIAAGRFDARVQIHSADEFEDLAQDFNVMAERLGRQFHALETLSEVDRRILASDDVEAVARTVLMGAARVFHSDLVAIVLRDFRIPSRGLLFMVDRDSPVQLNEYSVALNSEQPQSPEDMRSEKEYALDSQEYPSYLDGLAQVGAVSAVSIPAEQAQYVWAYVIIAYRRCSAALPQDIAEGKTVATRLAVALAASRRTQQLFHQAHYDALTQLPNRHMLMERLQQEIDDGERDKRHFALLFVDLDRFKRVNDAMGHSVGDRLLAKAASRLLAQLRNADIAARWGGDEFVIVVTGTNHPAQTQAFSKSVVDALSQPYWIDDREYHVGASVGIALYPDDGRTAEQLLQNADAALYRAKETGRGCSVLFETDIHETISHRAELEAAVRKAVQGQKFHLVYQPQIRLADGRVEAVEALLRWHHPDRGPVSPAEFVPVLEDIGAIGTVGEWVLKEACRYIKQGFGARGNIRRVAVNVSARQFWSGNFLGIVKRVLAQTDTPAQALELEITESMLLADLDEARRIVGELRAMGVYIALDDFGTGYSSLSYLRQLPVDTLKIDRSFLTDIERDPAALTIVEAIITMAHSLGRSVVAEGIETPRQAQLLTERACEIGQGFLFAPGLDAKSLEAFLEDADNVLSGPVITGSNNSQPDVPHPPPPRSHSTGNFWAH